MRHIPSSRLVCLIALLLIRSKLRRQAHIKRSRGVAGGVAGCADGISSNSPRHSALSRNWTAERQKDLLFDGCLMVVCFETWADVVVAIQPACHGQLMFYQMPISACPVAEHLDVQSRIKVDWWDSGDRIFAKTA
ncbi:hypothetical protein KCU83_g419, partial [Aureobasidium melanogenum]